MRNLLKAAFLLLFISLSIQSFPQFKAGVKAGLNIATVLQSYADSEDEFSTKPRLLYSFGPTFDIGFGRIISLQPSLLISAKGFGVDVTEDYDAESGYDRWTVNYLEIPINVAVKLKGFQIYAGPYIAIALFGKNKWDIDYGGGDTNSDETDFAFVGSEIDPQDYDEDKYYLKRMDYGLNLGVGYKLGPILFNAGFSAGLANLMPGIKDYPDYDPADYKTTNFTGVISVTYYFGRWR